jgi:hypothetical protein
MAGLDWRGPAWGEAGISPMATIRDASVILKTRHASASGADIGTASALCREPTWTRGPVMIGLLMFRFCDEGPDD